MELSKEERLKIAAEEIRAVRERLEKSGVGTNANRTLVRSMLMIVEASVLADDNADDLDERIKACF